MSKAPILHPDRSYTFRSYFEMSFEPEDILAEFGYKQITQCLNLYRVPADLEELLRILIAILSPPELAIAQEGL